MKILSGLVYMQVDYDLKIFVFLSVLLVKRPFKNAIKYTDFITNIIMIQ